MSGGLLGSTALEVAIGLSFVYLLLSLLCTNVNEWLATLLKTRAKMLEAGIRQLLDNQPHNDAQNGFLQAFYRHPLIQGLCPQGRHPSYLPARTFSAVIMDLMEQANAGAPPQPDAHPAAWVDACLSEGDVKRALQALVPPTGGDFASLQKNLEGWFDDAMDRISGWYKRRTQLWTCLVALLITVLANADTFKIVRHLSMDPALRQSVVEAAKVRAAEPRPSVEVEYKDPNDPLKPTVTHLGENPLHQGEQDLLAQLIGWGKDEREHNTPTDWLLRLFGWLVSIVAISLGAPFWFDVLNKFINIRSAGKSPDEGAKKPEKKQLPPADKAA